MKEWLGEHSQCYQMFMTEGQLHIQAKEFLHDGAYSSDIGDLAIAALSNMLQSPLVLFTSRPNQPLHIQHPNNSPMINPHPIYLAYLQVGPGHYDAVAPYTVEQDKDDSISAPTASSHAATTNCNCGRRSMKGNACSFSLIHYTCKCPCYNTKQTCTQYCNCRVL